MHIPGERTAAAAWRRVRSRVQGPPPPPIPVLTVIIPVYNVERYLRECLDSVLSQTLHEIEVIAVDDGSTDGSLAILHEYAARDNRLRVLTQVNSGQGIARNYAVAEARGEFLTFCDSDDTIPRGAYAFMVQGLLRTGSDFSVGAVRRFRHKQRHGVSWPAAHRYDRFGVTIDEFPTALLDIIACNRVFRSEFWRERVPEFRGHIAYEDHVPMLAAYVRADRFDILARTTYNWRHREDNTSTGQQKASVQNLLDRISVKEEANELLLAEASTVVYDAWIARTIDVDFPAFVDSATAGTDLYRNILSATYQTFFGRASDNALAAVQHFQKVRGWLCAEGRWPELVEAEDLFRAGERVPRTRVEDGRIIAVLDPDIDFLHDLPQRYLELAPSETGPMVGLRGATWTGARLQLTGYALIRGLDASTQAPPVEAWMHDEQSGQILPLPITRACEPEINLWVRQPYAGYDETAFAVDVDLDELLTASARPATWVLQVRLEQEGVVREGGMPSLVPGSSAHLAKALPVDAPDGVLLLVAPTRDPEHGFSLQVSAPRFTIDTAGPATGDAVTGRLRAAPDQTLDGVRILARQPATRRHGVRTVTSDVSADGSFTLTLRPTGPDWSIFAVLPDGSETPVRCAADWERQGPIGPGLLQWTRTSGGQLALRPDGRGLVIEDLRLDPEVLTLEVRPEGISTTELGAARLATERTDLPLLAVEEVDGRVTLRYARTASPLGGAPTPVPSGSYSLTVETRDGHKVTATGGDGLLPSLPLTHLDDDHRVSLRVRRPSPEVQVSLGAPLTVTERSVVGARRLQRDYRAATGPAAWVSPDSVLFQCYLGETATDSQVAIDAHLARTRPELVRYWAVRDRSTVLPAGAVPVQIGSQDWFDVLRSVTWLCNNIDFPSYFVKRPHQRYLQTFHGYPFKSMGATFWRGKRYSEGRIRTETARRNREWDTILVPSEFCAEFYRDEYDYQGTILAEGYPRCDALVNADRDVVRREVLDRLGVPHRKRVVLYAPTYRDSLTTRVYAAELFRELDLDRLTESLGPDYVILLRGHNNNQREDARVERSDAVVDVTDYPEINDLTLAADAAILDYSSLRFDWALTGRPVVFFVPDLDDYFRGRPPLFDYRDTTPGPLLSTTDQVVEHLRDLDRLTTEWAPAIADFNSRYNDRHDGHATERVVEAFFNA